MRWDCNGKNTPTKEEETEREKKLNQRLYTVKEKEEEDGVKDTGRSQREEHSEGTSTDTVKEEEEEGVNINCYVGTAMTGRNQKPKRNQ